MFMFDMVGIAGVFSIGVLLGADTGIYWCGVMFFFFSSRRRHTRFDCDWSSDVCSSDLPSPAAGPTRDAPADALKHQLAHPLSVLRQAMEPGSDARRLLGEVAVGFKPLVEIGRASCRGRV